MIEWYSNLTCNDFKKNGIVFESFFGNSRPVTTEQKNS